MPRRYSSSLQIARLLLGRSRRPRFSGVGGCLGLVVLAIAGLAGIGSIGTSKTSPSSHSGNAFSTQLPASKAVSAKSKEPITVKSALSTEPLPAAPAKPAVLAASLSAEDLYTK